MATYVSLLRRTVGEYRVGTLWIVVAMSLAAFGQSPPSWVGGTGPTWTPELGGGVWYQSVAEITNVRSALSNYPQPVLVGLRNDSRDYGYRFDLNTWNSTGDPNWPDNGYSTSGGPASQEFIMSNWETTSNVTFIWSMPAPDPSMLVTDPFTEDTNVSGYGKIEDGGYSYPWQTADYYAAYLQYLIEPASMSPLQYLALSTNYDFTTNSEAEVGTNWGNLRARRGHVAPYQLQAVILGVEPYTSANENFPDGGSYGTNAQAFRNAIRGRATSDTDPMALIPLGLCLMGTHPLDGFYFGSGNGDGWFKPLMDAVSNNFSDFSYIDSYHEYPSSVGDIESALTRLFPVLTNSSGFEWYWCSGLPTSEWEVDFTRSLWWYDDVHAALSNYTELTGVPSYFQQFGCAEHGLATQTQFDALDMNAGLHWAMWLAAIMRYHADWDMSWVLCDPGDSSCQLEFNGTNLTLTPAYYVYKMAQEFYGLQYVTNIFADNLFSLVSLYLATNSAVNNVTNCDYPITGYETAPEAVVRVFYDSTNGDYHLFVVNEATNVATISGWSNWIVSSWEQLEGTNYNDANAYGTPENHLQTSNLVQMTGNPLAIQPISVNHIVLSSNLFDVQFGDPSACEQMTGIAAVGNSTNDYWNFPSPMSPSNPCQDPTLAGGWLDIWQHTNYDFSVSVYADASPPCTPDDSLSAGCFGSWPSTNEPNAGLFKGAVSSPDGSPMLIDISLPKGDYDIYFYAAADHSYTTDPYLATFSLVDGFHDLAMTNYPTLGTSAALYPINKFVEGNQYVVFRNLMCTSDAQLVFEVQSTYAMPICNGLQILVH